MDRLDGNVLTRPGTRGNRLRGDGATDAEVVAALLTDGDSRTELDTVAGVNRYLCPPRPAPDMMCLASCTASPIEPLGFAAAAAALRDIAGEMSPGARTTRLAAHADRVAGRLLRQCAAAGLAEAILCPSGTDALLTATLLLAAERPDMPITAILPAAAETGTGVPFAAAGRHFDGMLAGSSVTNLVATTVCIALRDAAGEPLPADVVNEAFAAAARAAVGRAVVIVTHGTKTGLIAPTVPPSGHDVIVDACQARISPATVAAYLRQGWPVVLTGSKFFGGPAFSGAVLLPRRRAAVDALAGRVPGLGTILRWTAALAVLDAFAPRAEAMTPLLQGTAAHVAHGLAAIPAIRQVGGLAAIGSAWSDQPSIFTFAVRDPQALRLLSASELRPLYQRMADTGFLLGQPVGLGAFGGLRIALGARDLIDPMPAARFSRLFEALAESVTFRPRA